MIKTYLFTLIILLIFSCFKEDINNDLLMSVESLSELNSYNIIKDIEYNCIPNGQIDKSEKSNGYGNNDASLKNKIEVDTTFVLMKSWGCFHFHKEQHRFYMDADSFIFETLNNETRRYNLINKVGKKEFLSRYAKFENSIAEIETGGCTTTRIIEVINQFDIIRVTDSSCSWLGYENFISFVKG